MNISNLIIRLQELAYNSTDAFELMVLAKSIEKAKVGAVRTVATVGDLPTLPLAEDGELFLVEADGDLYFNVGATWDRFKPFEYDAMSWGTNTYGAVGDNTAEARSSPVTVVGGITNWSQVSAGGNHNLAVTDAGIAYAWGRGSDGRLGNVSVLNRSSPVTVVGNITNWSQVSAGYEHSLGVAGGIAYAWGRNIDTKLGDGTILPRSSPVTVVGGITNWSRVNAGERHSLGVTDAGIAYAWGRAFDGQLGDNTAVDKASPVTVVGNITNWSQVSAGGIHSLGLTNTGIAYAWGSNGTFGQLGDNSTISRSSPVTVVGGITNWSQVSAGSVHSLGLTNTGIAYAWGFATGGRLGDGTQINKSSPVTVVGGITNWSQVNAGGAHNLGVTDTGIIYAWGDGFAGRLGDNTAVGKLSPVTVVGGITSWSQVSTGYRHSLALKTVE
jgi:hypothetical protein